MSQRKPVHEPVTSEEVKARELWHVLSDGRHADDPLVGLAISGGGIRSACFGLGALQALERLKLFRHLDYVSTVSGSARPPAPRLSMTSTTMSPENPSSTMHRVGATMVARRGEINAAHADGHALQIEQHR